MPAFWQSRQSPRIGSQRDAKGRAANGNPRAAGYNHKGGAGGRKSLIQSAMGRLDSEVWRSQTSTPPVVDRRPLSALEFPEPATPWLQGKAPRLVLPAQGDARVGQFPTRERPPVTTGGVEAVQAAYGSLNRSPSPIGPWPIGHIGQGKAGKYVPALLACLGDKPEPKPEPDDEDKPPF